VVRVARDGDEIAFQARAGEVYVLAGGVTP